MDDELIVCIADNFGKGVETVGPRFEDERSGARRGFVQRQNTITVDGRVEKVLITLLPSAYRQMN